MDILLVEDNPGDVRLIQEAFEQTEIEQTHRVFTDGDRALEYLLEEADASCPDLVLLDLDLPGTDGCEILETLEEESRLQCLPVIVLSGSEDSDDVERCYDASANAYLTKPTHPDGYVSIVEALERFWFEQVVLPPISS